MPPLREEAFILAHSLRIQSTTVGKAELQKCPVNTQLQEGSRAGTGSGAGLEACHSDSLPLSGFHLVKVTQLSQATHQLGIKGST